jgi:hypothetical protein
MGVFGGGKGQTRPVSGFQALRSRFGNENNEGHKDCAAQKLRISDSIDYGNRIIERIDSKRRGK